MNTYIALFRGINVGGNNTLQMTDLYNILEDLGCQDIKTYIRSGNAVFHSSANKQDDFSTKISSEIELRFGFSPKVLVKTFAEINRAISNNPFRAAEADPSHLHLSFLSVPAENVDLNKLEKLKENGEQFLLTPEVFYLFAPNGVGRSKLAANCEKIIGVSMTDRNWTTVCKLQEIANSMSG